MNDFFLAKNSALKVDFDDVEVHQIRMRDFDKWLPCAEPIKGFLENKDHSDEIIIELIAEHLNECLDMLSLIVNKDREYLNGLIHDIDKLLKLITAAILANKVFFDDNKSQKSKRTVDEKSDVTWFDSFQVLIKAGHSHESIMNMGYGMFMGYIEAVKRQQKNHIYSAASYIRIAYHADQKGFEKFGKEMENE
ncbi:hypothetical protein ACX1NX_02870 [Acinetobacter sp. ANC 5383]